MKKSENENENAENAECHESHDGRKPVKYNWMNYALLAGIGIMLVVSLAQAVQIGSLQAKISPIGSGTALLAASSGSGGETNDQMNARMHPDQVQSAQAPSAPAQANRQVGGC